MVYVAARTTINALSEADKKAKVAVVGATTATNYVDISLLMS